MIRSFSASPIKSALAALAIVSCLAVPGAYAAQPTPPFDVDACGYVRGATGCTANDTGIVNIVMDPAFSGSDPTSCTAGTDVTLHLLVTVGTTATERYNIGVLFAKDECVSAHVPCHAGPPVGATPSAPERCHE